MEPTGQKPQNIVDTTDSLEAIGVCKSMKNFLFVVILIGLLLPQVIFWMNSAGLIEQKACISCSAKVVGCSTNCVICPKAGCPQGACPKSNSEQAPLFQDENQSASEPAGPMPLAATVDVAEEVEKVTQEVEQGRQETASAMDKEILLENEEARMPAEIPAEQAADESKPEAEQDVTALFKVSCGFARGLVAICNFVVLTGVVLYSLTLLMCLKISLTGRLGGINHVARAFFISLFLMVILVPWQRILPGVLVGTVWLPGELLCGGWCRAQCSGFWKFLFYVRFTGLWLIATWLLLWAQNRSVRWARATLRRLGVVR